ncbi:hypothetical protein [Streptomyces marianii]|uniref:Uncharacterized protein n=1 Tax=Streptomyces marianii TaxID=1817406 RepID=A0A5R9DWD0_9ACTN|nr:hypothetical protein [Streptomyces marianii]TLQ41948.1 hypothetical protein FEF34_00405 [Streptomyces marianii]
MTLLSTWAKACLGAACASALLVGPLPREQQTARAADRETVPVGIDAEEIRAPRSVQAGKVLFAVRSKDGRPHMLEVFQPRDGVSVREALEGVQNTALLRRVKGIPVANPPNQVAQAVRETDQITEFFGGALVDRHHSVRWSATLCPGTYYLIDLEQILFGEKRWRELEVTGSAEGCDGREGRASGDRGETSVELVATDDGPRIRTRTKLPAQGVLSFTNRLPEGGGELLLQRLRRGVTPEDVSDAMAVVLRGELPTETIVDGQPFGLGGLSAHRNVKLHLDSRPGRYLLFSAVPDPRTGLPQTRLGAWRVVTLG